MNFQKSLKLWAEENEYEHEYHGHGEKNKKEEGGICNFFKNGLSINPLFIIEQKIGTKKLDLCVLNPNEKKIYLIEAKTGKSFNDVIKIIV
jgi:hypothetical protein